MRRCVFCRIVAGRAPAKVVREWDYAMAFVPLNPVTEGHVLVVPREHLTDALEYPWMTGRTFCAAATLAKETGGACNLITSVGAAATQTIKHLHVHVVPRREGDGLALPWTGQEVTDDK